MQPLPARRDAPPPPPPAGKGRGCSCCYIRAIYGNTSFHSLVCSAAHCGAHGAPFPSPSPSDFNAELLFTHAFPFPSPSISPHLALQGALSGMLSAVPAHELQPLLEALGDVQLVELMLRLHGDLLPQECRGSPLEGEARRVMSLLVALLPDMLEPHMRRQLGL